MIKFKQIDWREVYWKDQLCLHPYSNPDKWNWFQVQSDFNIPVGHLPWLGNKDPGFGNHSECKLVVEGGVFAVAIGEYQDTDKNIRDCLWMVVDSKLYATSLSREFIKANELSHGGKLLADVTQNVIRDKKLEKILD